MIARSRASLGAAAAGLLAAVAAAAPGPSRAGDWGHLDAMAVSPELAPVCAAIQNSLECARAIERRQAAAGGRFERAGGKLTIRLGGGASVELEDDAAGLVAYSYVEHLPRIRQHLVHVQRDEEDEFLLVDDARGTRTAIAGVPIVSPDGRRVACARGNLLANRAPIEIWRFDEGALQRELAIEAPDWLPGVPEWLGDDAVRVARYMDDADGARLLGLELYVRRGGAWKAFGPTFSSPFRCGIERGGDARCLADELPAGKPVALVGPDGGVCAARTGGTLTFDHPVSPFAATALEGAACGGRPLVAVVGDEASAVRALPAKAPPSPAAQGGAPPRAALRAPGKHEPKVSVGEPEVRAAGDVAVFSFKAEGSDRGPAVVRWPGGVAALQGWCTGLKTFFTVSGRLHLAYEELGCDNGIHALYVYDVSVGAPILVYENGRLSM